MLTTNLVRPSRDGDQFHYVWAARRCLLLLAPYATLKAITIEGSSPSETVKTDALAIGEELIDIGEYYGSENIEQASLIRYIQLKHSTLRTQKAWTPSGLKRTLKGFSARYVALQQRLDPKILIGKLEFWFVSNRPIDINFLEAIHDAAEGVPPRHANNLKKLEQFTGLNGIALSKFCKLLRLQGKQEDLWDQWNILSQDVSGYLAGADVDAPVQLKELVTRKALSASAGNPSITRMDVLRAFKTDDSHLLPAPCLIKDIENMVPREQEKMLFHSIVQTNATPIIIHAAGGVGKSVFASRIKYGLPKGSVCILYDCFGNGQYRNVSSYRHRHKDAFVQIANELAMKGLCHPLIPSQHADSSDYAKTFIYRLNQSISSLRSKNTEALLCIVIDAADNAQMASDEIGETRSFVRDLIREQLPEGIRLVFLCRTHRQEYLAPPPNTLRLELQSFSRTETKTYLLKTFPKATEQDVDEFHRLSSQNPRVQALALARQQDTLDKILRAFGPNPTTVEDMLGNLLDDSIASLRDAAGTIEKTQIDSICAGLAALRPFIPLSVLASMSGVNEAAIKSFAFDLGRPLLVTGDAIQFIDEPAETWFRDRFKPTADNLTAFVKNLKPLSATSAYVASTLPQLMLEAGHIEELVALALSSDALPTTSPVEKRDVELQRLQFALKACLRAKRYTDAAKLALKAGGESAGDERQRRLLQANTDLAAVFLNSDRIQELVSRRTFGSGWVGSHHAYEAGLLSGRNDLLSDARSRLRMAHEWLRNWSRLPDEDRKQEEVGNNDILEMATAAFHIYGADACAYELRRWKPREISFRVGRSLANRFIDHGRYSGLDDLAVAAENDLCLIFAITLELRQVNRTPPQIVVERALRLALNPRIKIKDEHWDNNGNTILAVTALVEAAIKLSVGTTDNLIELLTRYLPPSPPRGLSSDFGGLRFSLLQAYSLRAVLNGQVINLTDLAHKDLHKELISPKHLAESHDSREFKEVIGALLPWHILRTHNLLGQIPLANLPNTIAQVKAESSKAESGSYREVSKTSNEIARIWFDILVITRSTDTESIGTFNKWVTGLNRSLFTTTLTHLARLAAHSPTLEGCALNFADKTYNLIRDEREVAESKSDSYVKLARAVYILSPTDSRAYFNEAVEVASRIGDENLGRWDAFLDLSDRAASLNNPNPIAAYRLARCAELTYSYVARDKHFDWTATVEAISGLCGKSSFAIFSRWRDRDFGNSKRILPIAVTCLVARKELNPHIALALIAFQAHWDEPSLLQSALSVCTNKTEKEVAAGFAYRYMTLTEQNSKSWHNLKVVLANHGLTIDELDEINTLNGIKESESKESSKDPSASFEREVKIDWNEIFAGLDLSVPNDIAMSFRRFNDSKPSYSNKFFFIEACRRLSVGKESEFIRAIALVSDFNLYDLRHLIEHFPEKWKSRLSIKPALAATLKIFCRRFCMEINKNRYYEMFPLKIACDLSGISEDEIMEVILTAIGEVAEVAGAERLFTLASLIATKLTQDEATEALSFGLDLFDEVLEDADGDGQWMPKFEPPAEIEGAVAGYVWGGLAAPKASLRWESAHVISAFCTLESKKVIENLVKLASGASAEAFYDANLHFYDQHALQWLLIGLARAAKEHPKLIAPHIDFLLKHVFTEKPQIIIRETAKRTILTLLDAGLFAEQTDLRLRISTVNISPFPSIESKTYQFSENDSVFNDNHSDIDDKEDSFYWGIDMGPYWFTPLGRCFNMSQALIERKALHVIRRDWQILGSNRRNQDERHRRKIFSDRHMDTYHSHGSYPRIDDLQFYLSYHAMMMVAGELIDTCPIYHNSIYGDEAFDSWLKWHDITRQDGGWLADRRDHNLLERPKWKIEKETDEWPWSISKNDFDRILISPNGNLNLWGGWTSISDNREESINVTSAVVSSDRSIALLRALQSAGDPHDYRIPASNDDLQIEIGGFQLKGWVVDESMTDGIDKQDPWAGDISFPPPLPATYIIDIMNLSSDLEFRRWFVDGDSDTVLWSQVWGSFSERDDHNEMKHESGSRFQASLTFIVTLLQKLNSDLIIKIVINRNRRYYKGQRNEQNEIRDTPSSARLFLIRTDGSICTL